MNKQDNYTYEEVLELTKQGVEIWRRVVIDDIVFDYEVSNLGRIKSLKSNLAGGKRIGYGSLNDRYMYKGLYYTDENGNKKCKQYQIHRLVAITFIPNLDNKPYVDHISTDRINNKVNNLRWVTQQENMNNSNTIKNKSKAQKGRICRKLTDEEKYPYVTEEDTLVEKWKPIKGYEGIYEISDMGRIKGLGFKKDKSSKRFKKGLLQVSINKSGYQSVNLTDRSSKVKTHLVHQLVAKHFVNNPNNYNIVDHINTNKADNRHFNLKWVTQLENINNDKTKGKMIIPVIVLDKNGSIISNGLGIVETAKNIGVSNDFLTNLLKSHKPYKAGVSNGGKNIDLLRSLNGIRAYYIFEYDEEKVLKEIAEDKISCSYCIGDLTYIHPEGVVSKPMSGKKLAKELGVSEGFVRKLRDSKKPYKAPSKCNATISKEHLEHLQTLEGIRIMYYEDYLKEQNQQDK